MVNPGSYAAISAVCAVAVIYHGFSTRRQFYPVMLYLSHSKISLLFLLNMGFVMMCGMWQLVNIIFLGALRETEVERLNEEVWREIMDILFAMTVFKDEFNLYFLFLITVLLFIKAHHWLTQKRVEYVETTPSVPALSHVHYSSVNDNWYVHQVRSSYGRNLHGGTIQQQGRVSLLSGARARSTASLSLSSILLSHFHVIILIILAKHYGLPLHLVRELYETFRNFKNRIFDYLRYRRLTYNMSERFADASAEDLSRWITLHDKSTSLGPVGKAKSLAFNDFERSIHTNIREKGSFIDCPAFFGHEQFKLNVSSWCKTALQLLQTLTLHVIELCRDATCIVCREDMVEAKILPCGHSFHVHCLRQWLERQNTCPTCRAPVISPEEEPYIEDQPLEDDAQVEEGGVDFTPENIDENGDGESYGGPAVVNATNWLEVQAAATTAAANYGSSFVLPVLSHGYAIWYPPLFLYQPDADLLGRVNMDVRSEGPGQFDNIVSTLRSETYAPAVMVAAQYQHDVLQRWIWKHAITQTAELVMQLQQNAMRPWSLAHRSTSASPPLADPNLSFGTFVQEREEEETQDQSELYAILRKHLQKCLALQHQVSATTVEQLPSVSGGTRGGTVNQELVHHLHGPGENCEDSEFRYHVDEVETIDGQNVLLSISTNPLYNSSLPSSSSSTQRAETS